MHHPMLLMGINVKPPNIDTLEQDTNASSGAIRLKALKHLMRLLYENHDHERLLGIFKACLLDRSLRVRDHALTGISNLAGRKETNAEPLASQLVRLLADNLANKEKILARDAAHGLSECAYVGKDIRPVLDKLIAITASLEEDGDVIFYSVRALVYDSINRENWKRIFELFNSPNFRVRRAVLYSLQDVNTTNLRFLIDLMKKGAQDTDTGTKAHALRLLGISVLLGHVKEQELRLMLEEKNEESFVEENRVYLTCTCAIVRKDWKYLQSLCSNADESVCHKTLVSLMDAKKYGHDVSPSFKFVTPLLQSKDLNIKSVACMLLA